MQGINTTLKLHAKGHYYTLNINANDVKHNSIWVILLFSHDMENQTDRCG